MSWFNLPVNELLIFWGIKIIHGTAVLVGFALGGILVIVKMFAQSQSRAADEGLFELIGYAALMGAVIFFIPERLFSGFNLTPFQAHLLAMLLTAAGVFIPILILKYFGQ